MPEIEFTLDHKTGEMEMEINGVQGPGCADIAEKVKEVMGAPSREETTPEYHARTIINRQVQNKGSK